MAAAVLVYSCLPGASAELFLPKITETVAGKGPEIETRALRALAEATAGLGIDLSALSLDRIQTSPGGAHVVWNQQVGGIAVEGRYGSLHAGPDGRVIYVRSNAETVRDYSNAVRLVNADAVAIARAAIGADLQAEGPIDVVHVLLVEGGAARHAYRVSVSASVPAGDWIALIDAGDGSVLSLRNVRKTVTGSGRVFDPNPPVTLSDASLADHSDSDEAVPEAAYLGRALNGLTPGGYLRGEFVSTFVSKKRSPRSKKNIFTFSRSDDGFEDVMVYYHIDTVQRYIQSLGFTNVLNKQVKVDPHGTKLDQSWYSPLSKKIVFGTGGVDDAEDADIILHEYGHAIQDNQVPDFGSGDEGGAMGEGFGDYLAASFFEEMSPDEYKPLVGEWDATSYSRQSPPYLRRVDGQKVYPTDMQGEVHDDGEIWSAMLWSVRGELGRTITDRLIIESHFYLAPDATFRDGANALLAADFALYNGEHMDAIRAHLDARGIPHD